MPCEFSRFVICLPKKVPQKTGKDAHVVFSQVGTERAGRRASLCHAGPWGFLSWQARRGTAEGVFYIPVVPSVPAACSPLLRGGGMSEAEPSPTSPHPVRNHVDMRVNSPECVVGVIFIFSYINADLGLRKTQAKQAKQAPC